LQFIVHNVKCQAKNPFEGNKMGGGGDCGRMLRMCRIRVNECENSVGMCSDNNLTTTTTIKGSITKQQETRFFKTYKTVIKKE
jgi:hypothetical protein